MRQCGRSPKAVPSNVRTLVDALATGYRFLHLHATFPEVFSVPANSDDKADNELCGWSGGFAVVLGNPPWERVKLQEKEWFAVRDPEIAEAPNAAARKRLIADLPNYNPALHTAFLEDVRNAEGESVLLRNSGRYPLGGRGDVNTYAVFAELVRNTISPTGRVGVIVPTGIATDDTTKFFFADLVKSSSLVSLFDFENRRGVFPGVHRSYKFSLLTMTGGERPKDEAEFVFFALDVADLDDRERRFTLSTADFALLNPDTLTCPVFRTRRDADLTRFIYKCSGGLIRSKSDDLNTINASYVRLVDYGDHAAILADEPLPGYLGVYEAKMIHSFDHRYGSYDDGTRIRHPSAAQKRDPTSVAICSTWLPESEYHSIIAKRKYSASYHLGYREIARSTDERTMIASLLPGVPAYRRLHVIDVPDDELKLCLLGYLNSFLLDYIIRQKHASISISLAVVWQLPLPTTVFGKSASSELRHYVTSRVSELAFTSWDVDSYSRVNSVYVWNDERRTMLRAELDAFMFRLFSIERDDVDYILDTFPIVKRKDEAAFGEYRTKRLILERFDAMADADASRRPYETVLDPPPAHPSLAHPESARPAWALQQPGRS